MNQCCEKLLSRYGKLILQTTFCPNLGGDMRQCGEEMSRTVYGGPHCQDKIGPILRKSETFERVPRANRLSTSFTA